MINTIVRSVLESVHDQSVSMEFSKSQYIKGKATILQYCDNWFNFSCETLQHRAFKPVMPASLPVYQAL